MLHQKGSPLYILNIYRTPHVEKHEQFAIPATMFAYGDKEVRCNGIHTPCYMLR